VEDGGGGERSTDDCFESDSMVASETADTSDAGRSSQVVFNQAELNNRCSCVGCRAGGWPFSRIKRRVRS
jgi:hypothetical protein